MIRHVIYTQTPGIDGDGITLIEKEQMAMDVADAKSKAEQISPGSAAPAVGAQIAEGIMGPVWKDGPVNADWYSDIRQSFDLAGAGGRVEFSRGVTYNTPNAIELQSGQQVIGKDVLIQATGAAAFKSKNPASKVERVQIDGLRIYGNNNLGIGFDFTGLVDCHVSNFHLINWVDYGAVFGGTEDSGGWSNTLEHGRIWASPASSESDSACVWIGGVNSGSIPNGNNTTIFDVRMQAHANHAVVIDKGDGNQIIACDMGYAAADNGFPAVVLRGGVGTRGNNFLANRYEKAAGSLLIEDANDNIFVGEYYGTKVSGTAAANVRIAGGSNNYVRPSLLSTSVATDLSMTGGTGNVVEYRGVRYGRTAGEVMYAASAPADATPRFTVAMNGEMSWGGTGTHDVKLNRFSPDVLRLAFGDTFLIEGGAWDTGHLQLGTYHFWVDGSGNLRVKNGAPNSASDGTVVGAQT